MTRNHLDFLIAKVGFLYETTKLFPNFFSENGHFYMDFTLLVFLVVNLVLVSMFRVCCETGPIFLCFLKKKSPNRMAWKPLPVGGSINPK